MCWEFREFGRAVETEESDLQENRTAHFKEIFYDDGEMMKDDDEVKRREQRSLSTW